MIVLVTGGRAYQNQERVFEVLQRIHTVETEGGIDLLIQGGAEGADKCARLWAASQQVPLATYHAHWASIGKSAGPLRNEWMLEFGQPWLVVAFPGGKGTAHMVKLAEKNGTEVRLIQ
jgi:hypothetical protein